MEGSRGHQNIRKVIMEDKNNYSDFEHGKPLKFNSADRMLGLILLGVGLYVSYQIWGDAVIDSATKFIKQLIPFSL